MRRTSEETAGAPQFHRLDPRAGAADQIYDALRAAILAFRLPPGEPMSENRVAGLFGCSRSPARIALTRLAEDGLIEIFPQRGTFVAPIRLREVRESHFARTVLESALAAEAAPRWGRADGERLEASIADQERHARDGDVAGFHADNEVFHQTIAAAAGLPGVWRTVQGVKLVWDRIGQLANPLPGHREEIIAEHRELLEALTSRDPVRAEAAMQRHMRSVWTAIDRLRPTHAAWFVED